MRGAGPKVIQELLGHRGMRETMRYMHLAPEEHRKAIDLLDRGHHLGTTDGTETEISRIA